MTATIHPFPAKQRAPTEARDLAGALDAARMCIGLCEITGANVTLMAVTDLMLIVGALVDDQN